MPDIMINYTMAANERVTVFGEGAENWKFRRCPYPKGLYTVLVRSAGVADNVHASIQIGTTEVLQRSPVQVGGTTGVIPVPQTTPAHQFYADGNDEVQLILEETAGATPVVQVWANVEPA